MDDASYYRYQRLLIFLSLCIDSPDTSIRREATSLYGEVSAVLDTENARRFKGVENA